MGAGVELVQAGADGAAEAEELWLELFLHHRDLGAAGFPTIDPAESWPRRAAYYRRLFEDHREATFWFARSEGSTIGYAMAHAEELGGDDAMLLETLCVGPPARGRGVGSRLMEAVDGCGRDAGLEFGAVDVLAGNDRARELYVRRGYRPYTEVWMRSDPARSDRGQAAAEIDPAGISSRAEALGLGCRVVPGPDDTWVSADTLVGLAYPGVARVVEDPHGARLQLESQDDAPPCLDGLAELFDDLAAAGMWTILFEVPAAPGGRELRDHLYTHCGFGLCGERLARRL